ncbi:MAG: c-type cytochrome biogenesis protein CcmI [Amaricoccus sp.]
MLFWGIALCLVLGSLGLLAAPLIRGAGGGTGRARFDMAIYRDQIAEIGADRARGLLTEAEAEATRVEIGRRLIAAADAEAGEPAAAHAPRALSRAVGLVLVAGLAAAAFGLYARLGAPNQPDQPLQARLEAEARARANRPGQEAAEAMAAKTAQPAPKASPEDTALVAKLQAVLADRPDDVQGHRLLAQSLGSLGRWSEARAAQGTVVQLEGGEASAQDLADWAELMVLAAGGYVSPEAEQALARALDRDPRNPVARYYSGLTLAQGGRPDLAYRLWSGLLAEGPPDAPWIAPIRAQIGDVAGAAGLPPPPEAGGAPDIASMAPDQRAGMIEGMVAGLAERLAGQGGSPEEWARLITAYGVLGRLDDARQAWQSAEAAFAGNPAALATLAAAANQAGLAP